MGGKLESQEPGGIGMEWQPGLCMRHPGDNWEQN